MMKMKSLSNLGNTVAAITDKRGDLLNLETRVCWMRHLMALRIIGECSLWVIMKSRMKMKVKKVLKYHR